MSAPKKTISTKTSRQLRAPRRRWWRRTPKSERPILQALPSGWRILGQSRQLLWQHKKLFLAIVIVYAICTVMLVQGLTSSTDVQSLKTEVANSLGATGGQVAVSVNIVAYLLSTSVAAGAYQVILLIVVSLALIWALRQTSAAHPATMRNAYYRGMYPLVPFALIVVVGILQLIPCALGAMLYNIIATYNIAQTFTELTLSGAVAVALIGWSVYMVIPTIMALYVVTLADMTPLRALRSARQLVRYRRWNIIRKLLLLGLVLLVLVSLVMIPAIMFTAPVAAWVFFGLSVFLIAIAHTYCYNLYRELLNHA